MRIYVQTNRFQREPMRAPFKLLCNPDDLQHFVNQLQEALDNGYEGGYIMIHPRPQPTPPVDSSDE